MKLTPTFIYGTAWKENDTADLTCQAILSGFRAIDTANQKKHYQELLVGEGLRRAYDQAVRRDEIFLQSKYTFVGGQDHRLPYDASQPIADQVAASFQSSLSNLQTSYLDSYLLHGPSHFDVLTDEDWEAWGAIEKLHHQGLVHEIGVSNVKKSQLKELLKHCKTPPHFVQNRCFAQTFWDQDIRKLCQGAEIRYQAFSLLTANSHLGSHPDLRRIAATHSLSLPQLIFCFARHIGMIPLTGSRQASHLREDLEALQFVLTVDEIQIIENIAGASLS